MIRCSSSAAALFVKVSPRIWEAETSASWVSHTTRAAMTAVLPLPAPAMMARGTGSWTIAAHCSSLGSWPRRAARTAGLARRVTAASRVTLYQAAPGAAFYRVGACQALRGLEQHGGGSRLQLSALWPQRA